MHNNVLRHLLSNKVENSGDDIELKIYKNKKKKDKTEKRSSDSTSLITVTSESEEVIEDSKRSIHVQKRFVNGKSIKKKVAIISLFLLVCLSPFVIISVILISRSNYQRPFTSNNISNYSILNNSTMVPSEWINQSSMTDKVNTIEDKIHTYAVARKKFPANKSENKDNHVQSSTTSYNKITENSTTTYVEDNEDLYTISNINNDQLKADLVEELKNEVIEELRERVKRERCKDYHPAEDRKNFTDTYKLALQEILCADDNSTTSRNNQIFSSIPKTELDKKSLTEILEALRKNMGNCISDEHLSDMSKSALINKIKEEIFNHLIRRLELNINPEPHKCSYNPTTTEGTFTSISLEGNIFSNNEDQELKDRICADIPTIVSELNLNMNPSIAAVSKKLRELMKCKDNETTIKNAAVDNVHPDNKMEKKVSEQIINRICSRYLKQHINRDPTVNSGNTYNAKQTLRDLIGCKLGKSKKNGTEGNVLDKTQNNTLKTDYPGTFFTENSITTSTSSMYTL